MKVTVFLGMTPWRYVYKYTDVSSLTLFWVAAQRVFACYRRFRTANRLNFQRSVSPRCMDILTAEGGTETLSQNVGNRPTAAA
jgi:hypothetical protein